MKVSKIVLLSAFAFLLNPHHCVGQQKVWFDTDQLLGNPTKAPREVDDAIALILALYHNDKIKIEGISLITDVDYGKQITEKILQEYWAGNPIPIYKGSDQCKDIGVETEASTALAAALAKTKLSILAIGPATNIATVIRNHPEVKKNIKEVIFCAGRTPDYPFTLGLEKVVVSDYNVDRDPEAFQVILDSKVPIVLSGFECSQHLFLGKTDYEFLQNGDEFEKYMYQEFLPWSKRFKTGFGIDGFVPWDTTPVGYLTHPKFFKYYENIPVHLIQKKNDATLPLVKKKKQRVKKFLEASYHIETPYKALFAYKPVLGFEEKILEALKAKKPFGLK